MDIYFAASENMKQASLAGETALRHLKASFGDWSDGTFYEIDPEATVDLDGERNILWIEGMFPTIPDGLVAKLRATAGKSGKARARALSHANLGLFYLEAGTPIEQANYRKLCDLDEIEDLQVEDLVPLATHLDYPEWNAFYYLANARRAMHNGVWIVDPERTYIDMQVNIESGVRLEPGVCLQGQTRVGRDSEIGTGAILRDVIIAEGVIIKPYTVLESSTVGRGTWVGPFAHIRPQSELGENVRVGNFVETKKTKLGDEAKASHLSYLGDADIGSKSNIGAGTITCNYDGVNKHRTVLGEGVFIGSDSQLVAPVTLGKGAYVAAGSTITEDVPADALAIGRGKQVNKEGRAEAIRQRAQAFKAQKDQS